jgi:hypothetical protein
MAAVDDLDLHVDDRKAAKAASRQGLARALLQRRHELVGNRPSTTELRKRTPPFLGSGRTSRSTMANCPGPPFCFFNLW